MGLEGVEDLAGRASPTAAGGAVAGVVGACAIVAFPGTRAARGPLLSPNRFDERSTLRASLLDLLRCVHCQAALAAEGDGPPDGDLREGWLRCTRCGQRYPVRNGMPFIYVEDEHWAACAREAEGWVKLHKDKGIHDQTNVDIDFRLPYFAAEPWLKVAQMFDIALEILNPRGGEMVLDLGAGRGWAAKHFSLRGCRSVAIDVVADDQIGLGRSQAIMRQASTHYEALIGDHERMPFRSGVFDLVFASGSIHHTSDVAVLIREIARVLKPGGRLLAINEPCIAVHEDEAEVLRRDCAEELAYNIGERRPNLLQYRAALAGSGFANITIFPYNSYRVPDDVIQAWPSQLNVIVPPRLFFAAARATGLGPLLLGLAQAWTRLTRGRAGPPSREAALESILLQRGGELVIVADRP